MVVYYSLLGQKVGSHWLAIGTLSSAFLGGWALTGGKKAVSNSPPINAKSSDEETFIQDFLKNAEKEENKNDPKAREGGH